MSKAKFNPRNKMIVDSILLKQPSVVSGIMYGYPAYYTNKKLSGLCDNGE